MMKSAMKASMKMKKSMKAMVMKKAMKKRAMNKTAAGARAALFAGKIMKSKGGLKKEAFTKLKSGKIVSKKAHAAGKKLYTKYGSKWMSAVAKARKALGYKGFVPVGGKTAKGAAFLKKAKSFYKK